MSLFKGGLTARRYRVIGEVPADFRTSYQAQLEEFAFHEPTSALHDGESAGWTQIHNLLDTDFSDLNRWLEMTVTAHPPPQKHNHKVRMNYITQHRVRPPSFIIFGNSPEAVSPPYIRYLENRLRDVYGFEGTPIRIKLKRKRRPGEAAEEQR